MTMRACAHADQPANAGQNKNMPFFGPGEAVAVQLQDGLGDLGWTPPASAALTNCVCVILLLSAIR
jgi:hypothetical protein